MMNYMSVMKEFIPQSYLQQIQNHNLSTIVTYCNTTAFMVFYVTYELEI
jgi:hypothetical protein